MAGKLSKEQVELSKVINSAIAQHAQKRSSEPFSSNLNKIGFSSDLSRIEAEPIPLQPDYYTQLAQQSRKLGEMDPSLYAEVL